MKIRRNNHPPIQHEDGAHFLSAMLVSGVRDRSDLCHPAECLSCMVRHNVFLLGS